MFPPVLEVQRGGCGQFGPISAEFFGPDSQTELPNKGKMKAVAMLLCLGAARAADLDGDGVTDAAADGTCCALTYGNALSGCSGATTLAGAAGCCPSDWLLRLSIGSDGKESTDSYDCVSFMSQSDCAAYTWSGLTPSWMTSMCAHFLPTPAPTDLTPPPTPKGFRDNDKDGVEDAAADGTCCTYCQGCAFSGCSGATDFAGTASCCPAGFLHRYHIGYDGEDKNHYDCVSFVAQADCTAHWTAANCPHTTSSTVVDAPRPAPSASWRSSPSFSLLDRAVAVALHRRTAVTAVTARASFP